MNRSKASAYRILLTAITFALAWVFVYMSICDIKNSIRLEKNCTAVTAGRITSSCVKKVLKKRGHYSGKCIRRVIVKYKVKGKTYTVSGLVYDSVLSGIQTGDNIQIHYIPEKPQTAYVENSSNKLSYSFYSGTVILVISAFIFLYLTVKAEKRENKSATSSQIETKLHIKGESKDAEM